MLVRLLLTAVLAVGLASAQRGGGGGGGGGMGGGDEGGMGGGGGAGGGGGMGGGMPQARRQTKAELLFDKLKLSKEQKETAVTILSAAMEKAAPVRDQLAKGRMVIANSILAKAGDEEIKKFWNDYTTVNAQMTGIEAEAFGKIYAMLKPNQQSKAPQAFELMAGMFAGTMGGGGGGMGGRGRGGQSRGEGRQ